MAEPPQGLRAGAVLIIHDVWGYTDFYKDLARRIAAEGYAGALVDLFTRQGELPEELLAPERRPVGADGLARARARSDQLSDERALNDIQLTVDDLHAKGAPGVVCWGFCWGGRVAYVAGAHVRGLAGVIGFYGFLKDKPPRISPLDIAADIRVPLLGVFAGADEGIPADQVKEFEERLQKAGKTAEIITYARAPHGFLRYAATDHAAAISHALGRTYAFLGRTLEAAP